MPHTKTSPRGSVQRRLVRGGLLCCVRSNKATVTSCRASVLMVEDNVHSLQVSKASQYLKHTDNLSGGGGRQRRHGRWCCSFKEGSEHPIAFARMFILVRSIQMSCTRAGSFVPSPLVGFDRGGRWKHHRRMRRRCFRWQRHSSSCCYWGWQWRGN